MQNVVFDEPYSFVPPYRGRFWSWAVGKFLPRLLRTRYGITSWTNVGFDHLRESIDRDYGILLCPNHNSLADPMMCGAITTGIPCHAYAMASWHVFKQGWLENFIARRVGGFSIYREGMDRKALDAAVGIVSTAERPLVIFPEGVISGANDRLMPLMDGVSFVARAAARKRQKAHPESKVVVHPVGFVYEHQTPADEALPPVLSKLERSFFWRTQDHLPLLERIQKLRDAVQTAREIQILGAPVAGDVEQRIQALADHVLRRYEREWLGVERTGDVIVRVKDLRIEILKDMVTGQVDDAERSRRWSILTDVYFAQCISLHVEGYLDPDRAGSRLNHRMFETVARLEEELTDSYTIFEDIHAEVRIGPAMEVDPQARRSRNGDGLMSDLRTGMLNVLGIEDEWPPQEVRQK